MILKNLYVGQKVMGEYPLFVQSDDPIECVGTSGHKEYAQVFAAAPELLEILKQFSDQAPYYDHPNMEYESDDYRLLKHRARNIILKAEGRDDANNS